MQPDGRTQKPGGSNRVVLRVADLPSLIDKLAERGRAVSLQVEDPDGNAVELFEAGRYR